MSFESFKKTPPESEPESNGSVENETEFVRNEESVGDFESRITDFSPEKLRDEQNELIGLIIQNEAEASQNPDIADEVDSYRTKVFIIDELLEKADDDQEDGDSDSFQLAA